MHTVLDEAKSWFLDRLVYTDKLYVVVVEGIRGTTPEDIHLGPVVIKDTYALEPTAESQRLVVSFPRTVAWQVVDESYTSQDDSEVRDDMNFLCSLTRSAYLDYVQEHHAGFEAMIGPAVHYRLWTENEVIDVVAHDAPIVERLKASSLGDALSRRLITDKTISRIVRTILVLALLCLVYGGAYLHATVRANRATAVQVANDSCFVAYHGLKAAQKRGQ